MDTPEPCIKDRCYSPVACNGWGYCRERNAGRCPSAEMQAALRKLAQHNKDKAGAQS